MLLILSTSTALLFTKVICRQKQSCFFVSTTNLTKDTNPFVGINERRRSPNKNEFGKAMRHVHVDSICSIRRTLAFMVLFSWFVSFVSFVVQQYWPLNEIAVFASEFHGYPRTFVWLCLRCWVARFNAPQGQQLIAQGTALGKIVRRCAPCKGKSNYKDMIIKCFCPYRTQLPQYIQPRVIPWAISFWAFSPWICCSASDAPFI